jgi:diadenosine tetraphosphate (Ap4A) HIT family hydrolase
MIIADACWFCLANPKVTKHLITSIGNEVYATLAKGPLVTSAQNNVPGGGHILLIPITHYETIQSIPMESQVDVVTELERFKSAFRRMFDKYGQDLVVTEISRHSNRHALSHANIQIMPIPKGKGEDLKSIIEKEAAKLGVQFQSRLPVSRISAYNNAEYP